MNDVKDNGIGVGLSCTKIITEFLGGTVEIVDPKKTTFKISIPVEIEDNDEQIKDQTDLISSPKSRISDDLGSFKWNNCYCMKFQNTSN